MNLMSSNHSHIYPAEWTKQAIQQSLTWGIKQWKEQQQQPQMNGSPAGKKECTKGKRAYTTYHTHPTYHHPVKQRQQEHRAPYQSCNLLPKAISSQQRESQ
jgi:hypothetical protein